MRATLQKAIRGFLGSVAGKHGHSTLADLAGCPACVDRLWEHLEAAAPRPWVGGR